MPTPPVLEDPGLVRVLEPDQIRAIEAPTFTREPDVPEDVWVVGVEVGDEARAYPLPYLRRHQVVNDEVGGVPVAVTYCPLTGMAAAFDRRVAGFLLTFKVTGSLYKNNLVMYDEELENWWIQFTGKAATGDLAGESLDAIVATDLAEWSTWRRTHPHAWVMEPPTEGAYEDPRWVEYEATEKVPFPVAHPDARLSGKRRVAALQWRGEPFAKPLDALRDARRVVLPDVGGDEVVLEAGPGGELRARTHRGKPIRVRSPYWFAWADFYPDTKLV